MERKIIIGLITNTAFCTLIKDIWDPKYMESATARLLSTWCWEYFNKYQKAPGKDIESIYTTKLKTGKLSKDVAEEIEQDILPSLNQEFQGEEFNTDYLLEETEKYLNERHLELHTDNIQVLLGKGDLEGAEKLVREFKPLGGVVNRLDDYVLTARQIRDKKSIQPKLLLKPWLREGQLSIIYGQYGTGKSLLTLSIAYMLGVENFEEHAIGKWVVKNKTGCLYLDGELGEVEMSERIKQFEWMGEQKPGYKIKMLCVPEYQFATEDSFSLADRDNQKKVITWLRENPTYKLVVLDSASTLFNLVEENSNSEWNTKISPFLRDLRALNVACLLLHHAGKDSKRGLRGASAQGAMAHNIFKIRNHPDKDDGVAWLLIDMDKQRAAGKTFKPFAIQYNQTDNGTQTHWELTNSGDQE